MNGQKDLGSSRDLSHAARGVREPADAALRLARRTLEYIGWFDGSYGPEDVLDADAEMKDLALAVYLACGAEPPERVFRTKGKRA